MSYIRFVCPNRIEDQGHREGFFCTAYELREAPDIDAYAAEELKEMLGWFREYLPIPGRFNRTRSKGYQDRNAKGLSWFKADAADVIGKSCDLVRLLDAHGYPTEILRSGRIGYIVYEDDYQVVAEPFADTPT